jgi:hypothetical protein
MKKVNDNGGNFNPTQWSSTDANGNPLFYTFGVSIGGGGVNAIGFGLNSCSPTPNDFINMQPNLSSPGINFSYDDVSRFEPSYDFPAMREINPGYFYEKNAQQANGGDCCTDGVNQNGVKIGDTNNGETVTGFSSNGMPLRDLRPVEGDSSGTPFIPDIGGARVLLGVTKIPKVWLGISFVGEASKNTLLSTGLLYKLGVRCSIGAKL